MERIRIESLPHKDRPYEKRLCLGLDSLSGIGLLAVILRTGSREGDLLSLAGGLLALRSPGDSLLGPLHHSLGDLMGIKGVGKIKGIQLLCIEELSRRVWKRKTNEHALYSGCPEKVSDYYMEDTRHLEQEETRVMSLNTKWAIICDQIMTRGTINVSVMMPREMSIEGLRCRAVSTVLVHNHPNGDPAPNRADMLLTKRLKEAGELVGTTLVDRVIIGDRRYLSFCEENSVQEEVYP